MISIDNFSRPTFFVSPWNSLWGTQLSLGGVFHSPVFLLILARTGLAAPSNTPPDLHADTSSVAHLHQTMLRSHCEVSCSSIHTIHMVRPLEDHTVCFVCSWSLGDHLFVL